MVKRKYCSFGVRVTKAYVDDVTGLKRLEAIASDTGLDWYRERFAEKAIDDMVMFSRQTKVKKPNEGIVDLQTDHWQTFAIGYSVDGEKVEGEDGIQSYKTTLELKAEPWEANELYKDVKDGVVDKQLSVGGYIPDWEKDYETVEETFVNEDGDEVKVMVGVIKRFVLEHIAVTPPDGAANPRTEFLTAKSKLDNTNVYEGGSIYKSANDAAYQKRFADKVSKENNSEEINSPEFWSKFKSIFETVVNDVFKGGEREGRMTKLEKAKKMAEDFKKFVEDNVEEINGEEVLKDLSVTFGEQEELEVLEGLTEENVVEIVKAKLDEAIVDIDSKIAEVTKSIPVLPEAPVIPEDKTEEIETLKTKLAELDARLKAIEEETPGSQDDNANGEEDNDEDDNSEEDPEDDGLTEDERAWK